MRVFGSFRFVFGSFWLGFGSCLLVLVRVWLALAPFWLVWALEAPRALLVCEMFGILRIVGKCVEESMKCW